MKLLLNDQFIKLSKTERLHQIDNPIVAITGNIGGGKSTVSSFFAKSGLTVINADSLIHKIYEDPKTKRFVKEVCPEAINQDKIDFPVLRKVFFRDQAIKAKLEQYLYQEIPIYFKKQVPNNFIPIIYDVPLLFEKELHHMVDFIIVVATDEDTQLTRLLQRDQLSDEETLKAIIKQQIPNDQKRNQADLIIENTGSLKELEEQCHNAIKLLFKNKNI